MPLEKRRRLGNPTKRPMPKAGTVLAVAPTTVVDAPRGLGIEGRAFYESVLEEAPWVARTDRHLLADVAVVTDLLAQTLDAAVPVARDVERYMLLRWRGLANLGLDTASRSRLGVAEVKAMSKLEELRARRAAPAAP